jgi:hypothetical protein
MKKIVSCVFADRGYIGCSEKEILMKKIAIGIIVAVLVVIFAGVALFLDSAVKRGVENIGSRLTKVDVRLDGVNLSLMSGSGKLKGLIVGNPAGYKSPSAISIGTASLDLVPRSLFSYKVIIKSINVAITGNCFRN